MEQREQREQRSGHPGLIDGVAGLLRNMFGLFVSRIELAALELSEVRTSLLKLVLIFALAVTAAWFALASWTVLLVALTWEALGWKILLIVATGFTAAAVGIFLYAQSLVKKGGLSMPATMAELRNDRDALL